jgi:hypothetical protein
MEEMNNNVVGDLWFGYVGPWYDGSGFSKHEIHMGFVACGLSAIDRRDAWSNAVRYAKFHRVHPGAKQRDWNKLSLAVKSFTHITFSCSAQSILLSNDLYGQTFGLLFNNVPFEVEHHPHQIAINLPPFGEELGGLIKTRPSVTHTQLLIAKLVSTLESHQPDTTITTTTTTTSNTASSFLSTTISQYTPTSCTIL